MTQTNLKLNYSYLQKRRSRNQLSLRRLFVIVTVVACLAAMLRLIGTARSVSSVHVGKLLGALAVGIRFWIQRLLWRRYRLQSEPQPPAPIKLP